MDLIVFGIIVSGRVESKCNYNNELISKQREKRECKVIPGCSYTKPRWVVSYAINTASSAGVVSAGSIGACVGGKKGGANNRSHREQGPDEGSNTAEFGSGKQCLRSEQFVLECGNESVPRDKLTEAFPPILILTGLAMSQPGLFET